MKKFIKSSLLLAALFSTPLISCYKDQGGQKETIGVTGVTLNETQIELALGQSFQLEAKVSPNGANTKLTWVSTDSSVASVSDSGLVGSRKIGETTIKVTTENGKTAECKCIVKEKEVVSIEFEQATSVLFYGQTAATPRVIATYSDGSTGFANEVLTIASDDTNKVTVNNDGGTITCVAELTSDAVTTEGGKEILVPIDAKITATVGDKSVSHNIKIYDANKFFITGGSASNNDIGVKGIHASVDKLTIERLTFPETYGDGHIVSLGLVSTRAIATSSKEVGLYGLKNLKYLCLNSQLERIQDLALNTLRNLTTLVLPDTLQFIQYSNFGFANSLKEVRFLSGNTKVGEWDSTNDNKYIEIYDNKLVIQKYKHSNNSITTYHKSLVFAYGNFNGIIPEEAGVEMIGNYAFFGLKRLNKTIVLPKTLRAFNRSTSQYHTDTVRIGCSPFRFSNIENVVLPSDGNFAKRINSAGEEITFGYPTSYALGANNLKSFGFDKLPDGPEGIGSTAYAYSNNSFHPHGLKSVNSSTIDPDTGKYYVDENGKVIQNYTSLYWGCDGTYIPEGVKTIDNGAMRGVDLSNIVLPSTLEEIKGSSFVFCKSNKVVEIPASCKTMGVTDLKNQSLEYGVVMAKDEYGDFFSVDEDTDYFTNEGKVSPFFNLPGQEITIKVPFAEGFNPVNGQNSQGFKWDSAWNVGVNVEYTNN